MSLGCVACCRPLMKFVIEKRVNWALANKNGESVQASPKTCRWQEAEGEVYVSSCGHLYHKKCLFPLFSEIISTTNVTGHASTSPARVNGANHGVGICSWCESQMNPGNCIRVHLRPSGTTSLPIMLHYINYNNRIREQILRLNDEIKKREALLATIHSDRNFTKKLKTKYDKKVMKTRDDYFEKGSENLENSETQQMISCLNSKLAALLEESISAKETMNEVYSELQNSSPRRAAQYSGFLECQPIGDSSGQGVSCDRTVHLNKGQMQMSRRVSSRPYHHYHPSSHEILRKLQRQSSHEHQKIKEGTLAGDFSAFESSTSLLDKYKAMEYSGTGTAPPEGYQDDGLSSDYPVTPEYEPVLATFDYDRTTW